MRVVIPSTAPPQYAAFVSLFRKYALTYWHPTFEDSDSNNCYQNLLWELVWELPGRLGCVVLNFCKPWVLFCVQVMIKVVIMSFKPIALVNFPQ